MAIAAALAASLVWLLAALARGATAWTPAFLAAAAGWFLLWKRAGGKPWDKHPAAFCFLSALAVYLSTFRWHGGDDITNSLIPIAALRYHTLAMNPVLSPFLDGKTHDFIIDNGPYRLSFHPIFTGLLALPFYVIPVLARAPITETFLHNMSKISASCLVAASVAAFYRAAEAKASKNWALALSLVYAFGSFSLSVSSQALFQHGATQLGAALGFWGLATRRRWSGALAGLGFGVAVAARGDSVFFAAAAGLSLLWLRPREIYGFVAGAALPAAIVGSYWLHYTGRFAEPGTARQLASFVAFDFDAFAALLLSPTRGLLWFCPVAAFGVAAAASPARDERALAAVFLAASFGYWVFVARFAAWTAGMSFGPRYFSMMATVLLLLSAGAESWIRAKPWRTAAWAAAAAFSVLVHALGAYFTWPGSFALDDEVAHVWDFSLHPVANLLTTEGPLHALPIAARFGVFAACLAGVSWLARGLARHAQ